MENLNKETMTNQLNNMLKDAVHQMKTNDESLFDDEMFDLKFKMFSNQLDKFNKFNVEIVSTTDDNNDYISYKETIDLKNVDRVKYFIDHNNFRFGFSQFLDMNIQDPEDEYRSDILITLS